MIELKRAVTRLLSEEYVQGRPLCFRAQREGVLIKRSGQRWSSAYLVPWSAVWSVGAKIKAKEIAKAKQENRKTKYLVKRGGL